MKNNILKLEGYGVYVTYIDKKLYVSHISTQGGPTLDPDNCIEWEELKDPDNQAFLNEVNKAFNLELNMIDFGKPMSVSQIRWYVKNLKEVHK